MASAVYPNFYESIAEAHMRLLRTIVVYEGEPYKVLAITDHKKDDIFRVYLWPLGQQTFGTDRKFPSFVGEYQQTSSDLGALLDEFIEKQDTPLIRKYMSAAGFNKFRPFPLGMCNAGNYAYYMERRPVRRTEQGLSQAMVQETKIIASVPQVFRAEVNTESPDFKSCILGEYPSAQEVLKNLNDADCTNLSVGFHRSFAIARGTLDTLYLAYKAEIVGLLPYSSLEELVLSKGHRHLKEVCKELNLFGIINSK